MHVFIMIYIWMITCVIIYIFELSARLLSLQLTLRFLWLRPRGRWCHHCAHCSSSHCNSRFEQPIIVVVIHIEIILFIAQTIAWLIVHSSSEGPLFFFFLSSPSSSASLLASTSASSTSCLFLLLHPYLLNRPHLLMSLRPLQLKLRRLLNNNVANKMKIWYSDLNENYRIQNFKFQFNSITKCTTLNNKNRRTCCSSNRSNCITPRL